MINNLIANIVDVEMVQSVVSFSEDFLLCFFCCRPHLNFMHRNGLVGSANSPTLAVAASKFDIYQMMCVQFELLMMGGKPP
jgi:hypothetical protein